MYKFESWLSTYQPRDPKETPVTWQTISPAEQSFLLRAKRTNHDKLACFRMTVKVHKNPFKMRPIVCCVGTFMNEWSRWLDYWLQQLKLEVPTYIKDGQQLLNKINNLGIPPNAKLFTCDANSMYNNIDTEHAITVITWWLNDLKMQNKLLCLFPLKAVKDAMKLIMRNNIFE